MREKVILCLENRLAAGKCRKERRYLPDQTISPKARWALYFDFELLWNRSPKAPS